MSRTVRERPEAGVLLRDSLGATPLERMRSLSSDAPEDTEFGREILKLDHVDRRVVRLIIQRLLELEAEAGSDAAEAALEMLLRDLDPQSRSSA